MFGSFITDILSDFSCAIRHQARSERTFFPKGSRLLKLGYAPGDFLTVQCQL